MNSPALEISVREANPGDATAVALLSTQLGYPADHTIIQERLKGLAADENRVVFVAITSDPFVVGWIEVAETDSLVSGRSVSINGLVVDERFRRGGIGKRLIAQAEDWATSRGFDHISVRSNAARQGSHDFYPALGYTLKKTQHNYQKRLAKAQS